MIRNTIYATSVSAVLALSCFSLHAELKPEDLYSAVSPSIVTLEVENIAGKHFVANAFLAVEKGLAVTAWHVVHDARRVQARFADNQVVTVAGLVDKDENLDLALLSLESGARPRIKLASGTPRIGSRVYLVGSPRGLDFSMSEGLISQIRTLDGVRYYQLSCPMSPGDSGGPVLNDRGEVIGVVSWRKADAENVGFAVPGPQIRQMNAALATKRWPGAAPGFVPSPPPLETTPLVRAPVGAGAHNAPDTFGDFQNFLAKRAGQRVTVVVSEYGKETRFNFEIPRPAAK